MGLAESQEQHATRRARERYGLELTAYDFRRIVQDVHSGRGNLLVQQDDTRYLFEIEVKGRWCVIVYDPLHRGIRTFLPPIGNRTVPEYLEHISQFFSWE